MLKKFIKKYEGVSNVGNTPGNSGECVGLIQVYIAELGLSHIWGHAKDIFANASTNEYEKVENAPDIYPDEGDIICWNSTNVQTGLSAWKRGKNAVCPMTT